MLLWASHTYLGHSRNALLVSRIYDSTHIVSGPGGTEVVPSDGGKSSRLGWVPRVLAVGVFGTRWAAGTLVYRVAALVGGLGLTRTWPLTPVPLGQTWEGGGGDEGPPKVWIGCPRNQTFENVPRVTVKWEG